MADEEAKVSLKTYELNQMVMNQQEPLNNFEINSNIIPMVRKFFNDRNDTYFMLLNKAYGDYTVFDLQDKTISDVCYCASECVGCLTDRGNLLSAVVVDDDLAIEFWIKGMEEEENAVSYYLFGCDPCVIKEK